MTSARRAWAGPAGVTALEAASLAVGFLTQPVLMRALGPAGYGQCVLAVAVGVGVGTLTDFGFNFAGTRQAVQWADAPARRHRLFWAVLLAKLGVGAAALGVLALLPASGSLLPAALISALGSALLPTWYLMARGRLIVAAGSLLAGRVAVLGAVAVGVHSPQDAVLGSVLNCAPPLLALALAGADRELRAVLRPCRPRVAEIAQALRLGASTVWINAVPALGGAMVQALVGNLGSHATLGQYAAADKVRAAIQGLFAALGQALFPASVAAGGRPRRDRSAVLLTLAAAAALPLALLPDRVVAVVAGPGFAEAAGALRLMSLAVVSSTAVTAFGLLRLVAGGRNAAYAGAMLAGLAAHALALAALVPAHGAVGAAAALGLADLAALAAMVPALRRGAQPPDSGRR